jgi:IS5 family transposase
MEVNLLDFARTCKRVAQQALGGRAGEPASGGFARWKHVVLHCIHIEDEYTYREVIDRVSHMNDVRSVLDLVDEDLPKPSTLCKAFDRFKMGVWRALLRVSAQQLPASGHAALDATFFERSEPSFHYRRRSDRAIQTLRATTLVDTASRAVLDVQCCTQWTGDIEEGEQVARRNAGDLHSLSADKGYDKTAFRDELRERGVRPLIKHSIHAPYDHAHNARINDALYNQRWMVETSYSTTKRSFGSAVRAQAWYREFRECVLMFAVTNLERTCSAL